MRVCMACVKEGKGNNTLFTPPRPTTRQQPAAMDDRLPKQHEEAVALSGAPSAAAPPSLNDLLADNAAAAKAFDAPMSLGVKRKLAVVTCMDSRLLLDKMLPSLRIGDAEIIRNAGGRITPDVVRSLFVAQEVPELSTRAVVIIHHTDCGAQAAIRHHDLLVARMQALLREWSVAGRALQALVSFWGCLLLPRPLRKALLNAVMRPFEEPAAALRDDVWLLRHAPLMPRAIPIHGLVYDVMTGKLHHAVSSPGSK